ncbi:hypothetical protein Nepgr_029249 [Nepenthes gracilis]|uniref:Glutaredoxin n=1 Tax=Nepenthes gracilis TaxID=150966 RepID=A0AAD3Y5C9_NEPGR|nr:hypothetical protein Nepgr_029249 [Nepenthes gracilis]
MLQCMSYEGLQVNGKFHKAMLKERFKDFNQLFDDTHRTQSTWVVNDEQLQSELRVSLSAVMIPAYRSFVARCTSICPKGRKFKMQYKAVESWGYYMPVSSSTLRTAAAGDPLERVVRLASESAVVIFSVSSCCMCHAVKRLFCGMGVNPTVYELDQDPRGRETERALMRLLGTSPAVPVVFIGGKLVGAMDRVMASHINGTLVPLLKEAGALWL